METHPLTASVLQDDIVLIIIQGNVTEDRLPLLREDIEKGTALLQEESQRVLHPLRVLVDLSNLNDTYSPEALLLLADFEKKNRSYVERTICFGADIKIRFAGEIISALSNRENISFFDTKEEALASLKSDASQSR
ncbi:MAG TPA: hypothetical protein VNF51_00530 [Candidatus Paceibacterota bacterium]|nr:hypothetical protein [Candidatus Paceibacterota bacterium]